ncbi:MAG: hypothetical protein IKU17_00935 [Clostridia bacterium]|nr:hypothetical protein [Clostridia bacterium]
MKTKCKFTAQCLVVLLLFSLVGCNAKEDSYSFIECPLPGLEWNMTREEVWEVLSASTTCTEEEFNLAKKMMEEDQISTMVPLSMLDWEDEQLLGLDFGYYEDGRKEWIVLTFYPGDDGRQYLCQVIITLRAKDEAELRNAITAVYGEPFCLRTGEIGLPEGEMDLYDHLALDWTSVSPKKVISEEEVNDYLEKGLRIGRVWTTDLEPYYAYRLQPRVYNQYTTRHYHLENVDGCNGYFVAFDATTYVKVLHLENS